MTILIRGLHSIHPAHQHGVVTIGNFDGVHLGHQRLLETLVKRAHDLNAISIVMTFEPQPHEFFSEGNITVPRLTNFREKYYALAAMGVDAVLVVRFDRDFADVSADTFVQDILCTQLRVKHVLVGEDFQFGRDRQGDVTYLQKWGQKLKFTHEIMPTQSIENERISSTRVRQALAHFDGEKVKKLLGRAYTMRGRVCYGTQLGRQLGFPTANIYLHRALTPIHGIFFVRVYGVVDHAWPGAADVGTRPTVGGTRCLLEVHLLDFSRTIYGTYVEVEFCEKLREEERFDNLELLREKIADDVEQTRKYFHHD